MSRLGCVLISRLLGRFNLCRSVGLLPLLNGHRLLPLPDFSGLCGSLALLLSPLVCSLLGRCSLRRLLQRRSVLAVLGVGRN